MGVTNATAAIEGLQAFRADFYGCLRRQADALFELCDGMLAAVTDASSPVHLSLLAQRGEPIRDLQALARHATAAFTLQRYTHPYDASARRTADAMGDILSDVP